MPFSKGALAAGVKQTRSRRNQDHEVEQEQGREGSRRHKLFLSCAVLTGSSDETLWLQGEHAVKS